MDREQKKILVVGGKLQGVEIAYLARDAGYYVTVVDRNSFAPAVGIAHEAVCAEFTDEPVMRRLFFGADYVFPAVEDKEVLKKICSYRDITGTPLIFDSAAYEISSSKSASKQLFERVGVRHARPFPDCGFPVICKPDFSSGSHGVYRISGAEEWKECAPDPSRYVVEQYLDGPSYSMEVLGSGSGGNVVMSMITEILTDEDYDCKRVIAPAEISDEVRNEFYEIAEKINRELQIDGIFDIEVIRHRGVLYVLEIDARFPSQTPIAVRFSSGVNYVKELIRLREERGTKETVVVKNHVPEINTGQKDLDCIDEEEKDAGGKKEIFSCYQQMDIHGSSVRIRGERIMADAGLLHAEKDCCGADLLMSNYRSGTRDWRTIAVLTAETRAQLERKIEDTKKQAAAR